MCAAALCRAPCPRRLYNKTNHTAHTNTTTTTQQQETLPATETDYCAPKKRTPCCPACIHATAAHADLPSAKLAPGRQLYIWCSDRPTHASCRPPATAAAAAAKSRSESHKPEPPRNCRCSLEQLTACPAETHRNTHGHANKVSKVKSQTYSWGCACHHLVGRGQALALGNCTAYPYKVHVCSIHPCMHNHKQQKMFAPSIHACTTTSSKQPRQQHHPHAAQVRAPSWLFSPRTLPEVLALP